MNSFCVFCEKLEIYFAPFFLGLHISEFYTFGKAGMPGISGIPGNPGPIGEWTNERPVLPQSVGVQKNKKEEVLVQQRAYFPETWLWDLLQISLVFSFFLVALSI